MDKRETYIERLLHRIEGHIEDWRERIRIREEEAEEKIRVREEEVEAYRGELWAEAAERERLLVQVVSDEEARERSLEEVAKEHRVAFVVHSEEAGKALEKFADEGARLVRVIPGSESAQGDAGIKGSWLVFEQSR